MDFISVFAVGLTTGLVASLFARGTLFGIGRNIVNATLGAFVASWLVGGLSRGAPSEGSSGAILVALIGAIGLLLLQHAAQLGRRSWDRWTRSTSRSRAWRSVPRIR